MRPPASPPALKRLETRKATLEETRAEIFPVLKAAISAHGGNVSRAGKEVWPDDKRSRWTAKNWVRQLGLVEWARSLRKKHGQDRGRPRG